MSRMPYPIELRKHTAFGYCSTINYLQGPLTQAKRTLVFPSSQTVQCPPLLVVVEPQLQHRGLRASFLDFLKPIRLAVSIIGGSCRTRTDMSFDDGF